MFVHEYSDKEFEDYEDCRADLLGQIDSDDIVQHFEPSVSTLLFRFLNRRSDEKFIGWLMQEVGEAFEKTLEELITEYEEGEVE